MLYAILLLISLCHLSAGNNIFELSLRKISRDDAGGRFEHIEMPEGVKWTLVIKPIELIDEQQSNIDYVWKIFPKCDTGDVESICIIKRIQLVSQCDHHGSVSSQFNNHLPLTIFETKYSNGDVISTPFGVSFNCYAVLRIQYVLQFEKHPLHLTDIERGNSGEFDVNDSEVEIVKEPSM